MDPGQATEAYEARIGLRHATWQRTALKRSIAMSGIDQGSRSAIE
jgi:hypothetical protein